MHQLYAKMSEEKNWPTAVEVHRIIFFARTSTSDSDFPEQILAKFATSLSLT